MARDGQRVAVSKFSRGAAGRLRRRARGSVAVLVVFLLALALGACATSVTTAATVVGDRITVGELNAATQQLRARLGEDRWRGNEELARRYVLDQLVENRLLRLEAARNGIAISEADIAKKREADIATLAGRLQQRDTQGRDTLATSAARQLRGPVNARGGAALSDADLQVLVRAEIDQLSTAASMPSQAFPSSPPPGLVEARSASLASALASKGAPVPAAEIVPIMSSLATQVAATTPILADNIQSQLTASGYTSASDYYQGLQQQLLESRVEPLYSRPVNAITLQQLVTDNKAKATEALAKARAGEDFAALIEQYAVPAAQTDQAINGIGSVVPDFIPAEVKQLFPSMNAGDYSDVWTAPSQSGGAPTYRVFKIVKAETRAPNATELTNLRQQWLDGLRARYPVWENPDLNLPPRVTQ